MKVRLFEDSVRIRLSRREVADLGARHSLLAVTRFGVGELEVSISPGDEEGLDISFVGGRISVSVNARLAADWCQNDLEGLYAISGPCKIALEKDYACLHRTGDANEGTFPNPNGEAKLAK